MTSCCAEIDRFGRKEAASGNPQEAPGPWESRSRRISGCSRRPRRIQEGHRALGRPTSVFKAPFLSAIEGASRSSKPLLSPTGSDLESSSPLLSPTASDPGRTNPLLSPTGGDSETGDPLLSPTGDDSSS